MSSWSKSLVKQTRDILDNLPVEVFYFAEKIGHKGVCLQHADGRKGYISLNDCMDDQYTIRSHETDEILADFKNVDALIAADWAVD
ncbi:MAG: hypothetical protein HKM06_07130 [Spirochaetales bacterium]|nr:hypothetical protein [Spirochaetales bacterium]